MKKTVLHVECGNKNWTPTTKELSSITRKFREALKKATPNHTPVVATRDGVELRSVEVDEDSNETADQLIAAVRKSLDAMRIDSSVFGLGSGDYRSGYTEGFKEAKKQLHNALAGAIISIGMNEAKS